MKTKKIVSKAENTEAFLRKIINKYEKENPNQVNIVNRSSNVARKVAILNKNPVMPKIKFISKV